MRCLREEEEQRELERQFIAQLERKRQERLNVEQMRNQRARALEELKRQEMMRTPAKANCMNVDSYPTEEELIQGLDGHLFMFLSSNSPKINRFHYEQTINSFNNVITNLITLFNIFYLTKSFRKHDCCFQFLSMLYNGKFCVHPMTMHNHEII